MQTLLYVSTSIGLLGAIILGVMYGLAAREVGELTSRLVLLTGQSATQQATISAQEVTLDRLHNKVQELEDRLLDELDIAELVEYFNGMLPHGPRGDDN